MVQWIGMYLTYDAMNRKKILCVYYTVCAYYTNWIQKEELDTMHHY